MEIGLQTHIRGWCDPALLREVRSFDWTVARIDAQQCRLEDVQQWIEDSREAGLHPYVIVTDADQIRALQDAGIERLDVELRNEPNLEGPDPLTYRALLEVAAQAAVEANYQLHAPAISNLDQNGLAYARAVGRPPAGVNGSFHWYSHGTDPTMPHPGLQSREDEVHAWLEYFGYGIWGVSESGFHTAAQPRYTDWRKNLPYFVRWSDDDVARYVQQEIAFWERMGAAFWILFQLNDGPEDIKEHRFGIRRHGEHADPWKPVAHVLKGS